MNWQAISFDWNHVRAFLAAAEQGSLSSAARVLRSTQPTISRQISALEDALGVTLLERSVRGLTVTEPGFELLDHVRAMGEAATMIALTADGQSQKITGQVTLTSTDLMAAAILPEILQPLRQTAPGIRVRILATRELRDLLQREADIAIRHARPTQSDLIARHLGDFRANLYAARAYLERAGRPRSPRELAEHAFVGTPDPDLLIGPLNNQGIPISDQNFVLSSDSGVVEWEAFKAGFGISMLPEALCEAEEGLEKVLLNLPPLQFPIWLVTHRELKTNPRIRLVFDHLARGLVQKTSAIGE